MDIKDLLGENYKDGITIDEINSYLADKNFIDSTSVEKGVKKELFDKTASELAEMKKKLTAKMTEEEKKKQQDAELMEQYSKLKKDNCKLIMEKEFATAGFDSKEYSELVETFSTDDLETALKFSKSITSFRLKDKADIETRLKQEALATMHTPNSANASNSEINFSKEIAEAKARGDNATVVSLIRQQCEQSNKE